MAEEAVVEVVTAGVVVVAEEMIENGGSIVEVVVGSRDVLRGHQDLRLRIVTSEKETRIVHREPTNHMYLAGAGKKNQLVVDYR